MARVGNSLEKDWKQIKVYINRLKHWRLENVFDKKYSAYKMLNSGLQS